MTNLTLGVGPQVGLRLERVGITRSRLVWRTDGTTYARSLYSRGGVASVSLRPSMSEGVVYF